MDATVTVWLTSQKNLNLEHAQYELSRMSAEVPSSSRPRKIEGDSVCRVLGKKRLSLIRLSLLTNPQATPWAYNLKSILWAAGKFLNCLRDRSMISFKDHSLTRFGVWYQRVLFVPEGEFFYSFVQRRCDLVHKRGVYKTKTVKNEDLKTMTAACP